MTTIGELGDGTFLLLPADHDSRQFLVLGEGDPPPDLGEVLDGLPDHFTERLLERFASAGVLAGSLQGWSGRWVRLTAESHRIVREAGFTRDASGQALGIVRGRQHIDHIVRFEPAAGLLSTGFDPYTFIAALAIQQMMRQIQVKLDEIAEGVDVLIQGSKNDIEAQLAGAQDTIERIERRVVDRGTVDDSDWVSLASLERPLKSVYHRTFRSLDPLREFLAEDSRSLVQHVKALRRHGVEDAEFWLQLYLHSEATLKHWEVLYLLREAEVAPERAADEASHIRARAESRHASLVEILKAMEGYFERADEPDGVFDRFRFINRSRLEFLRAELARVANVYAESLARAPYAVPTYELPDPTLPRGPLIDVDGARRELAKRSRSLGRKGRRVARGATGSIAGKLEDAFRATRERMETRNDESSDEVSSESDDDSA